jgi:hypothetical protein
MGVVGEWHASHMQLGWRGVEHSVSVTGRERTVKAGQRGGAKKRRGWKRAKALSFGGNGKGGKALCFNGDDFRPGASGVVREAGRLMAQHGGERRWASVVA